MSHEEVALQVPGDLVLFSTDLKYGQSNDEVADLQEFLIKDGSYAKKVITGTFDTYTKAAVISFQRKYGVKPSIGYVGVKTRHKIRTLSGF